MVNLDIKINKISDSPQRVSTNVTLEGIPLKPDAYREVHQKITELAETLKKT